MKKIIINRSLVLSLIAVAVIAVSCNKENASNTATTATTATQSAVAASRAIAVAASDRSASDSIYVINTCAPHSYLDTAAFSSLPSSVTTYLTSNYPGYTFNKAYTVKDTSGNLQGYVAIITYNGKPVGLTFDASGNFKEVLEQREGHDLNGAGWHHGGRFQGRDNLKRDTVALSSLPSIITSYLSFNYPLDTLSKAYKNEDSGYVVLSIDNGVFATVFNAAGTFVKRVQLTKPSRGFVDPVDQSLLPAASLSYLNTTYPGYVFKHAYKIIENNVVQGYVVFIDSNNTKYAVEFDASGKFISEKTVW